MVDGDELRAAWGEGARHLVHSTQSPPEPGGWIRSTAGSVTSDNRQSVAWSGAHKRSRDSFETSMLDDRISADVTWYRKTTDDALFRVTTPPSEGFLIASLRNVGKIQSRGWENEPQGNPSPMRRWSGQ